MRIILLHNISQPENMGFLVECQTITKLTSGAARVVDKLAGLSQRAEI